MKIILVAVFWISLTLSAASVYFGQMHEQEIATLKEELLIAKADYNALVEKRAESCVVEVEETSWWSSVWD